MCGIVGILRFDNSAQRIEHDLLLRMRETMAHRGPDGAGAWISPDGRVGFGFRRLAIIDLSPEANQPMTNEDGSLRLVYNGEIYNHAEIRRELEAMPTTVSATNRFQKEFKRLARKYPSVTQQVEVLIGELENDQRPGDKIPHVG